ncbi:hypothetical protein [Dyella jiangningensis]|uniref:Uncharacterized protein n=1 Tax=Dyella jiangningensis TaxID=1379159 RepID=A0A328PCD1_9GAMM|nr:hypothetical protein [Dyella jiangningensis]RAO78122.1 hypothetical protein CA260_09950 [Dyella jiangningensis]
MQHARNRRFASLAAAGLALVALASAPAMAQVGAPASGLGQSWPNATDVSSSPHWHVYLFERNGIRYVQVNDLSGRVRAAFARSGGSFLALPVGVDASRLGTPQEPLAATTQAAGEIVYRDATTTVLVSPQPDGTARVYAADGDCKDPIECSSRAQ